MDKYLILENGVSFKGKSFGYDGEAIGELVFTTKTTGYLETLSDPAYYGQIVLQTFPLIGNYGVITEDFGPGPMHLKAYIVRQWCQEPSNFRCEGNLDSFLCDHKIPGLYDIDTRALTRVIRENGTMNAMLSDEPELTKEQRDKLKAFKIGDAVAAVCAESNYSPGNYGESGNCKGGYHPSAGEHKPIKSAFLPLQVAMWDFGDGFRSAELLLKYGCNPITINHNAPAGGLLNKKPDGIYLTGGPGDPSGYKRITDEIKRLIKKDYNVPILAVGLGHQMLAIANGAKTEKLRFGHRGTNQPVKECNSNRAFVTNQNHGYVVTDESLPDWVVKSYVNINDGTNEGIDYMNVPAISVQFEPTKQVMERFIDMMKKGGK